MRRLYILFIFLNGLIFQTLAKEGKNINHDAYRKGDSIMQQVIAFSKLQIHHIQEFDGETYLKGNTEITDSNLLLKWFPWAFPFNTDSKESVYEIYNHIHFEAPNHFIIQPNALRSSTSLSHHNQIDISPLLYMNVYEEASINNRFLMPGSKSGYGIYEYKFDSIVPINGTYYQRIKFTPRRNNLKVIKGYLYIKEGSQQIAIMKAEGRLDIAHFRLTTYYGNTPNDYMLPSIIAIKVYYNIVNNISENTFLCRFKYNQIKWEENKERRKKRKELDLTRHYSFKKGEISMNKDSSFWAEKRQYSLTNKEKQLYFKYWNKGLSYHRHFWPDSTFINYQRLSEMLVSTSSFGNEENLQWSYSGLINPSMIAYSKLNGIVLRQRLFFNKTLPQSQRCTILPEIGFGFKQKELFYRFQVNWLYFPQKLGALSVRFRNGNKGFSSSFIDKVNQSLDSTTYKFDNLDIDYYHDYQTQIENSIELSNGLMLYAGVQHNLHKTVKENKNIDKIDELKYVKNRYADFITYLRLEWTPFQYYRWIGKEKRYIASPCPTFSVEYSKGIPDILGSNSKFNKLELDIHQSIDLPQLRSFSYRIGCGGFFNQKSEYFVDYRYFQRSNYPATWEDHFGGVFNLLDNRWYYASPQYVQLHMMYESPFILLHPFKRISKFILSERLYLSQLYSPAKPSYTELGYGIGNYIYNIALFSNFHGSKFSELGIRFSFELGRYW